jgi:hypothetical protein
MVKKTESRKNKNTDQLGLPLENLSVSPKYKDEKLVTVEIQKEYDTLGQSWENRVFVKLFVAARTSGLLKKISDREFKTLIALALYMDENGNCYPSQDQVARDLGLSRETTNRRIQSLLRFRFDGKPIVQAVQVRSKDGKWNNVRYTILPVAQLKIFEKPTENEAGSNRVTESSHGCGVTKTSHGPCDDIAMWQNRHTNKNQSLNKNNINNVNKNAIKNKKEKRTPEKEYLAQEMAEKLNDDHSLGFYRRVADLVPENLIFQALSEVKDAYRMGRVKKNKAALFNVVIQEKAEEHNINLNIKKTGSYDE